MTVADDLATLQDPKAPHAEALARVRAEIARLEKKYAKAAVHWRDQETRRRAAEAEASRLRDGLEWVKHALPVDLADKLTEIIDGVADDGAA